MELAAQHTTTIIHLSNHNSHKQNNEGWRVGEPGLALTQSSLPVDLELGLAIVDGDNDYIVSEFTVEFDPSYNNTSTPIAIDLDRSGSINYLTASSSLRVAFDDQLVETAWIAPSDALLVYDANNSGGFDDYSEIALTSWGSDKRVQTDLEALDAYFNLNGDSTLIPQTRQINWCLDRPES